MIERIKGTIMYYKWGWILEWDDGWLDNINNWSGRTATRRCTHQTLTTQFYKAGIIASFRKPICGFNHIDKHKPVEPDDGTPNWCSDAHTEPRRQTRG
jgi:hypothetical protein